MNKTSDNPIRQLKALTGRFVLPSSRTRKNKPLTSAARMKIMAMKMIAFANNLVYSPPDYLSYSTMMVSLTRFKFNVISLRFGILALLFCLFFARLGFWQLARADEKRQMLAAQQQQSAKAVIDWQPGDKLPVAYQPIQVRGHFSPITLLLDNQHYRHQFGYNVLSPIILDQGGVLLVDRGWVPGDANRENLPKKSIPLGAIQILGSVYYPSQKNWSFGNIFDRKKSELAVIELIDTHVIGQFLHKSVYPFIIRMHPADAHGFVREWPVVAMSPERHVAYAVQWFAMAFVVVLIFIGLTFKKKI